MLCGLQMLDAKEKAKGSVYCTTCSSGLDLNSASMHDSSRKKVIVIKIVYPDIIFRVVGKF